MEMKNHMSTQDTNHVSSHKYDISNNVSNHASSHVSNHVSIHALDSSHNHTQSNQANQKLNDQASNVEDRRVVLLGSGDMSRSLIGCLVRAGYRPIVATRNPARAKSWVAGDEVEVCGVEEGVGRGDLVVVAIPPQHHHTLPRHLLINKIIVDISNRSPDDPSDGPSLAEKLQELLRRPRW